MVQLWPVPCGPGSVQLDGLLLREPSPELAIAPAIAIADATVLVAPSTTTVVAAVAAIVVVAATAVATTITTAVAVAIASSYSVTAVTVATTAVAVSTATTAVAAALVDADAAAVAVAATNAPTNTATDSSTYAATRLRLRGGLPSDCREHGMRHARLVLCTPAAALLSQGSLHIAAAAFCRERGALASTSARSKPHSGVLTISSCCDPRACAPTHYALMCAVLRLPCGQIETFDEAAFIADLISQMGGRLSADDVSLSVAAASLRITVSVITRDETLAQSALEGFRSIANTSVSELSSALGVPVTAVGAAPTMQAVYVPSLNTEGRTQGSASTPPIAVVAVAALVTGVVALGAGLKCWWGRSHRKATQLLNVLPTQMGGAQRRPPDAAARTAKSPARHEKKEMRNTQHEMSNFI